MGPAAKACFVRRNHFGATMDEFLSDQPPAAPVEDDPFGLGSAPVESYEPPAQSFEPPSFDMPAEEPLPAGDDPFASMPAADPLPTFGSEPVPSFGEEPSIPAAPLGGLGDEFSAPDTLGPVAKWRIEQQEKLAAKASAAEAALAQRIAEAQASLTTFYEERSETSAKRAAANREAEARYVEDRDAAMVADSWASVCNLVDLKEKEGSVKDTSRMRGMLVQLKHT